MQYCIYKHTFPDGKAYIGQTISGRQNARWNNGRGYQYQSKVWEAISLFGWDSIRHETIIDDLTKQRANILEQLYITFFNSVKNGYNTKGEMGRLPSDKIFRDCIRAAVAWEGKKVSDVALEMGMSGGTLSQKLNGKAELTINDLINAEKAVEWTRIWEAVNGISRNIR